MASGIVTIGRRQYASGLYWENSPSGRVAQAAKDAARQPGQQAYYYAVRSGDRSGRVPQFGLSHSQREHKSGMPALAACIANQQPGSWAGAFRLREGVAVVVVRDDLIVPDGDQFFQDETEARDRLLQEMALGGLQRVYAPEAWGVPGADTLPVSLLLNDRADVRLRQVALSKEMKLVLLVGGLGLLLALSIGWYIQEKKAREEAERLQAMEALQRAQELARQAGQGIAGQPPPYPVPERTWEKRPAPLEFVSACNKILNKIPLAVAGWRLSEVKCVGASATTKWDRAGGFSSPPPDFVISDLGTDATQSFVLPTISDRGHEELADPVDVTRKYLLENWPATLNRVPDDPPPPPPPGYNGPWNPPPVPWIRMSFTMNAPVLPWTLSTFFADLPGVVLNSLTLNPGGGWNIEGVIYENRR